MAVILAIVVALRFFILPASYFSYEPHQAATTVRVAALPMHYGGVATCRKCHAEQYDAKYGGHHRNVACETCHGPALKHAEAADPASIKPPAPTDRKFCPVCHAYDPSRPTGFPQIDPARHNPRKACIRCHDPHDPVPPETPAECSSCHGRIERTKAASAHALIACTTCHGVDEKHKTDPRSALPSKPTSREACGECHGTQAAGPPVTGAQATSPPATRPAPKVDLGTHGGTFLCWECHYAHLPEGSR